MSLDVYLNVDRAVVERGSGIFLRENGGTREISREEWDERFPGREPMAVLRDGETHTIYHANITHNLNRMAIEAGIYEYLWRPDEIGVERAAQIIGPLRDGLARLNSEPERFRAFNPANGWGDYEGLCRFVANYLAACEANHDARIDISR